MSTDIRAGSGSTWNHVEPALPIRPASSTAVRVCRVVVGTVCCPRALGRVGRGTHRSSVPALQGRSRTEPNCTEQDSSHSGFVPNGAVEEGG